MQFVFLIDHFCRKHGIPHYGLIQTNSQMSDVSRFISGTLLST